ncbi:MAG: CPBP family intramembrane metalloprotease [Thermoanaerobaculia bacterium]|nr:CPBP family intramembrane metalloprotease [Thermoanaerobaculia bacterium]
MSAEPPRDLPTLPSRPGAPDGASGGPVLPVGLRLLLYYLLVVVVLDVGTVALAAALGIDLGLGAKEAPKVLRLGPFLALQALLVLPLAWITRRFLRRVDPRPLEVFGLTLPVGGRTAARRQALLCLAGPALILGLWVALGRAFAELSWVGFSPELRSGPVWAPGPLGSLVVLVLYLGGFVVSSAIEEWLFRGYLYAGLRERLSWVNTAGVCSVLSVSVFAGSPEVRVPALVNAFLLGLALGALREATGSLWASTLFQALWNFLLACVLSLPVSGFSAFRMLELSIGGDARLTGGDYGPEGGWLITGPIVVLVFLLAARAGDGKPEPAAEPREP